jgi:oligoendopeptidase F
MTNLPNWDLSDLYSGINDIKITNDIALAKKAALVLESKYKGKVAELSGDQIAEILKEYENISTHLGRVITFAYLNFVTNMLDETKSGFYQDCFEKVNAISKSLIFLGLELCDLNKNNRN